MKANAISVLMLSTALALVGYSSAHSGEPASPPPPVEPQNENVPPFPPGVPSDPLSPRQEVALRSAERLDQLDDVVAELHARCDERSTCLSLAQDFKQVDRLRANVLAALANLRDPEIGFDAAARAVRDSITEYDLAIQVLRRRVGELSTPITSVSSPRPDTLASVQGQR